MRALALVCALGLTALFAATVTAPQARAADPCTVQNGLGSFGIGNWPAACWRPYADSSPFNRSVPDSAPSVSNSSAIVSRLLDGGEAGDIVFGDPAREGGNPTYWSQSTDPLYTLHCVKPWGRCSIEGEKIRIPSKAIPTGGFATPDNDHDAHMTIVDQQTGWEYDLWNVNSKPAGGGTLTFGWGGKTRIDGDGLGSDGTAARYGNLAGIIRIAELRTGAINHALAMVVPCTETYVYPAMKTGLTCSDAGMRVAGTPAMGAHFQLRMSEPEIKALDIPAWKKTIVRALARYGAYVSDTTGAADQWGFEFEASQTFTSFGVEDPGVAFARSLGVTPEDWNNNGKQEYWLDLAKGVPWQRFRVVEVCAARGTCQPPANVDPEPTEPVVEGSPTIEISVSGEGRVVGPGINCPGDCTETFEEGAKVTLRASVRPGSAFHGWKGSCTRNLTCEVAVVGKVGLGARFSSGRLKVAKAQVRRCWLKRGAWSRTYRRTHDGVDRRYHRIRARWASSCGRQAARVARLRAA